MRNSLPLLAVILFGLCACTQTTSPPPPTPTHPPATRPSPTATAAPSPSAPPTDTPLPPSATPTASLQICPPLQGIPFAQLPAAVSNPYHPPKPGKDDPHAGVDLADRLGGGSMAVAGRAVQAALAGQVAAVVADRFPFGNALIVETPLEGLPVGWLAQLNLPTPAPTPSARPALTCPGKLQPAWSRQKQSLYLLYAHLQTPPAFKNGDAIQCGLALGAVGMSGNALNPHLHLEARVGPAGARFGSLAHYDNRVTAEEMDNYCLWAVSGWFQLLDPLRLFAGAP